jgi:hypothetical protein
MHSVETPWIRYSFGAFGMIASTVLLGVSMTANYMYGFTLARDAANGQVYAAGAAAVDVIMALCPFFFFAALETWHEARGKALTQALASFLLWGVFMGFAFQAVVSHASANRLDAMSARTVAATGYDDTRKEIEQARKDRGFIPEHRPEASVRAELEKHKTSRIWNATSECNTSTNKAQREFCQAYHTLNAELGYAVQATRIDARIDMLTTKSDKASERSATVVASEADPGAKTWALIAGIDLRTMQGIIVFGFATVILLGASLGHYVSSTMFRSRRRKMITVDAETATRAEVKAATNELLALAPPKPKVLAEIIVRPDPTPEARALLTAADFPLKSMRGPLRQRDERYSVLPNRFMLWLRAHDIEGEFETNKLQSIYAEYTRADHREPWDWRIVGKELTRGLGRYNAGKAMRKDKETGITNTYFLIKGVGVDKLKEQLLKKGIIKEPEPPGPKKKGNVFPLGFSGGGRDPSPSGKKGGDNSPAPEPTAKAHVKVPPVKGRAELQPDIEGMWALARHQKAVWNQKLSVFHRKQLNRFSRSRGAA